MTIKVKTIVRATLAASLLLSGAGCVEQAPSPAPPPHVVYIQSPPPADIVEYQPPPPDGNPFWVWQKGHWRWNGNRYVWMHGHWVQRPPNYTMWVAPHWENRNGGYFFIEGHWQ